MTEIPLLGLDPSLRNFGIAVARLDLDTLKVTIDDLILVKTGNQAGKQVRKNSDDLRRATELTEGLHAAVKQAGARFVISEMPHGSQSFASAKMLGVVYGVLASLSVAGVQLIQVQADETKLATGQKKTASKAEMIAWATRAYPAAPWLTRKLKGKMELTNDNEHLADAVAVIQAGLLTSEFKQAMAIMRSMAPILQAGLAA